ncbi:DgyrCDS11788 [Dimorphilus gyrociliatus]|uniref:Hexosyltransferase n=2 Tax=Dimorphilus gyrociliatus TaxID=2664684 RepID=A0A7I8W5S1_9ANNE|nr:DgyrCDS11788 [Dimorphilus gyrociliatus]
MGGPGMFLSRATLKAMCPYVDNCINNVVSTHEDVEVGRCITQLTGAQCSSNYEMKELFYFNYRERSGTFSHSLEEDRDQIEHAITLHPIKNDTYVFRMENFLRTTNLKKLHHKTIEIQRKIKHIERDIHAKSRKIKRSISDHFRVGDGEQNRVSKPPSWNKIKPKTREHVIPWDSIDSHSIATINNQVPKRKFQATFNESLGKILKEVNRIVNVNEDHTGYHNDLSQFRLGYKRVNPFSGVDHLLQFQQHYKFQKKKKSRKIQFGTHQAFGSLQSRLVSVNDDLPNKGFFESLKEKFSDGFRIFQKPKIAKVNSSCGRIGKTLNIVMPLSGRYRTYLRFMRNFEEIALKCEERVSIVIVLSAIDPENRTDDMVLHMKNLAKQYPNHNIQSIVVPGKFSRGISLDRGAQLFAKRDLVCFVDVDLILSRNVLQRMARNTIRNIQAYYPIMFSQFDPGVRCSYGGKCSLRNNLFSFEESMGYWRQSSFGMACAYKSDLDNVGGFLTAIEGWGKEDLDLYDKFTTHNVQTMRSIDPGMVHVFHPILCHLITEPTQYKMCLDVKASTYASLYVMSAKVSSTSAIYGRKSRTKALSVKY